MPAPSAVDLAALPNDVGLVDAWAWWAGKQSSTAHVVISEPGDVPVRVWWRSPRVAWGILAASVFASAWVLRAQVRPLIYGETPAEVWTPVADTTLAHVNGVLLTLGQTSAAVTVTLSPADIASLAFSSALRRHPPTVTNLEARADSAISIRGTFGNPSGVGIRFELRGGVRVLRTGLGQLDIAAFDMIDEATGRRSSPGMDSTNPGRLPEMPPIRFRVPRSIRDIRIVDGVVKLSTRPR